MDALRKAVDTKWPEESHSAATRAKRSAALQLLVPPHRRKLAVVEQAVHRHIGDLSNLGITVPLRDVLLADKCFILERGREAALYVTLDAERLFQLSSSRWWQQPAEAAAAATASPDGTEESSRQQHAEQQQQQQQQQQLGVSRRAHNVVSALQLLEFVASRLWHPTNQLLDAAKRALAVQLVKSANANKYAGNSAGKGAACADPRAYTVPIRAAGLIMKAAWMKAAPVGSTPPYRRTIEALAGDPYLKVDNSNPLARIVKLEIKEMLWDILRGVDATAAPPAAAATADQAAAAANGSGSSNAGAAACSSATAAVASGNDLQRRGSSPSKLTAAEMAAAAAAAASAAAEAAAAPVDDDRSIFIESSESEDDDTLLDLLSGGGHASVEAQLRWAEMWGSELNSLGEPGSPSIANRQQQQQPAAAATAAAATAAAALKAALESTMPEPTSPEAAAAAAAGAALEGVWHRNMNSASSSPSAGKTGEGGFSGSGSSNSSRLKSRAEEVCRKGSANQQQQQQAVSPLPDHLDLRWGPRSLQSPRAAGVPAEAPHQKPPGFQTSKVQQQQQGRQLQQQQWAARQAVAVPPPPAAQAPAAVAAQQEQSQEQEQGPPSPAAAPRPAAFPGSPVAPLSISLAIPVDVLVEPAAQEQQQQQQERPDASVPAPAPVAGGICPALAAAVAAVAAAVPGQTIAAQQLLFELRVHLLPGGWYVPDYTQYTGSTSDAGSTAAHSGGVGVSEVVESISQLLPERLTSYLQPYLNAAPGAASPLQLTADIGNKTRLQLSNGVLIEVPDSLNIGEQVKFLQEFKQAFQQLQMQHGMAAATTPEAGQYGSSGSSSGSSGTALFGPDNRMGVPGTLHRISAIRDSPGAVYGLTFRIGRHIPGVATLLSDVLSAMKASTTLSPGLTQLAEGSSPQGLGLWPEAQQNLLLLGRRGVGKTALLRDVARLLSMPADDMGGLGLSVLIVDTYNDIAGDSEHHHPAIGAARRVMVPQRFRQAEVMLQAASSHHPDVMIVDELATAEDVAAARSIVQRGVLLVAAAPSSSLSSLLATPELQPLLGGFMTAADGRGRQRTGPSPFTTVLEVQQRDRWQLHLDAEASADALLQSQHAAAGFNSRRSWQQQQQQQQPVLHTQMRTWDSQGRMLVRFSTAAACQQAIEAASIAAAAATGMPLGLCT